MSRRGRQEIVYIVVGPKKARFGLHKEHLCAVSPYFRAALKGNFQEAALGEVHLKDTNTTTFELFTEWLYGGRIIINGADEDGISREGGYSYSEDGDASSEDGYVISEDGDASSEGGDASSEGGELSAKGAPSLSQFLDVWLLGEYLLIPQLQNYVADRIQVRWKFPHHRPAMLDFHHLYKETQTGSVMRRLIVDLCIWCPRKDPEVYRKHTDLMPLEMGVDMLLVCTGWHKDPKNPLDKMSNYYVPLPELD